jgi:hypothetical protein
MIYSQNQYRRETIEELTARLMKVLRARLPGEDTRQ